MAQQITIDIVAETKKLTQGLDEANNQIGGLNKSLTGITKAATAAASAFILKEGISFLKQGIDEAKDARLAMNNAVTAFGKGSAALKKITEDANKFGKALGVDNDDLIKLSTQLGAYLPPAAKKLSAELVNLGYDVSAVTGIDVESWTKKFAKGMADGELKASDLEKMIPGLSAAVYKQAEASFKAGDAQGALNLLIEQGQKTYGDAAEKNVTSSQKFSVALGDLKEQIGTKVLPVVEKLVNILVKVIDLWDQQPELLKNVELGLAAIVGIGGPLLAFFASAKTALITLGIVSEGAAISTGILSVALKAIPILAVIALVILLISHWEDVQKAAKATWEAVSEWFGKTYDSIKEFIGKAIDWLKANWPYILAVLTGPFGLFAVWIVAHFEDIKKKISDGWENVKSAIKNKLDSIGLIVNTAWLSIGLFVTDVVDKIKTGVVDKWNDLKNATLEKFKAIQKGASEIWGLIRDFIGEAVNNIKDKFGEVYGKMIEVGKDIAKGIWEGLSSMTNWFRLLLIGWINANIPLAVRKILGIASPSKVMMSIGENITKGLYVGMGLPGAPGINLPQINVGNGAGISPLNITINAGVGTDPYALGREVKNALGKYGRISL